MRRACWNLTTSPINQVADLPPSVVELLLLFFQVCPHLQPSSFLTGSAAQGTLEPWTLSMPSWRLPIQPL